MDKRVLLVTADKGIADLVRSQVENLGCRCTVAEGVDAGMGVVDWAEVVILDLATEDVASLRRLREDAPGVRALLIAPDDGQAEVARQAGAEAVLVEPFSIADLVAAVRRVASPGPPATGGTVVDLRAGQPQANPVADDAPWWATR